MDSSIKELKRKIPLCTFHCKGICKHLNDCRFTHISCRSEENCEDKDCKFGHPKKIATCKSVTREQSAPVTNMSIENPLSASVPAIQQDSRAEVSSKRRSRKNSSQEVRARKRRAKMKKLLLPIKTVQQHHSASVPAASDDPLSASVPAAQQHLSASVTAARELGDRALRTAA